MFKNQYLYSQLIGFPKPFNEIVWFISLCNKEIENHYKRKYRKRTAFGNIPVLLKLKDDGRKYSGK